MELTEARNNVLLFFLPHCGVMILVAMVTTWLLVFSFSQTLTYDPGVILYSSLKKTL